MSVYGRGTLSKWTDETLANERKRLVLLERRNNDDLGYSIRTRALREIDAEMAYRRRGVHEAETTHFERPRLPWLRVAGVALAITTLMLIGAGLIRYLVTMRP